MNLQKRDCGMELKLVPYGAGWTDVYFNINGDNLYFIITSVWSDQFSKLLEVLYYLHPDQNDPKRNNDIDYWDGVCELIKGHYKVTKIVERCEECPATIVSIPHNAELHWDEEGSSSHWVFTREPTEDTDFTLQIDICIHRDEEKRFSYQVQYKDFCYAVAKTCTEVLKSHGIYGYHHSTYEDDLNLRHLLFVKSVALDCLETRILTDNGDGLGESTSFEKELELLLFDM